MAKKRRHVNAFSKIIIFFFFWESRSLLLVVLKNHITIFSESFGLILQNLNLICVIGTVESYLGFWGERLNFGITIAEIEEEKGGERKCWTSATWIPKFLYPILMPGCEVCVECPKWKEKKKIWQTNCGNVIAEIGKKKL